MLQHSGIRDNHQRGKVAHFLADRVAAGSQLSVVSAYFTIYAYETLSQSLDSIDGLRFLFGEPRFVQSLDPEKTDKKAFKIEDEGLTLNNRLQQKDVAQRCAAWIKNKVEIRSVRESMLPRKVNRTHYTLNNPSEPSDPHPEQGKLPLEGGKPVPECGKQMPEGGMRRLPPLPKALAVRLPREGQRLSTAALRALIEDLCGWYPLRGEELAGFLCKDLKYLRNKHLSVLVQAGTLVFLYPESPNHNLQAYKRPETEPVRTV